MAGIYKRGKIYYALYYVGGKKKRISLQTGSLQISVLKDYGAVGDINLRYFDKNGELISSDLNERVIGLSLEELKKTKHVVGVAGGKAKLKAIRGALVGGLINVLITDHVTAGKLLQS